MFHSTPVNCENVIVFLKSMCLHLSIYSLKWLVSEPWHVCSLFTDTLHSSHARCGCLQKENSTDKVVVVLQTVCWLNCILLFKPCMEVSWKLILQICSTAIDRITFKLRPRWLPYSMTETKITFTPTKDSSFKQRLIPRWLEHLSPGFSSISKGQPDFFPWTGHINLYDGRQKRRIRICHRSGTSDPYVRVIQVRHT